MATSEAQKRAVRKYKEKNKDKIHKFNVTIHDTRDADLWLWLTSQDEGKGTVIRRLMREEIKRTGWKHEE